MINTELQAAGIAGERLRESYRYCRRLNAEHGRTYFLATRLLAPSQRPAVHALYGFARYADDILDDLDSHATVAQREARLEQLAQRFVRGDEAAPQVLGGSACSEREQDGAADGEVSHVSCRRLPARAGRRG
jgi:phytoene synthase